LKEVSLGCRGDWPGSCYHPGRALGDIALPSSRCEAERGWRSRPPCPAGPDPPRCAPTPLLPPVLGLQVWGLAASTLQAGAAVLWA
jgi:hypothetical protein